jgi:large subunit ribosomal protein L20
MVRATNAAYSNRKRKRLMKQAKGFVGDRKNHRRLTSNSVLQAMAFNFRGRKQRKRDFRSLWINRMSVGAKLNGLSYSKLINGLKLANCTLDRKMLSEMAIHDPMGFAAVAGQAKQALA